MGNLVGDTSEEAGLSVRSSNEASDAVKQISNIIHNLNGIVEKVQKQIGNVQNMIL